MLVLQQSFSPKKAFPSRRRFRGLFRRSEMPGGGIDAGTDSTKIFQAHPASVKTTFLGNGRAFAGSVRGGEGRRLRLLKPCGALSDRDRVGLSTGFIAIWLSEAKAGSRELGLSQAESICLSLDVQMSDRWRRKQVKCKIFI